MASGWGGEGTKWTPELAIKLADLLTFHGGVGDGPVAKLRQAAEAKSPILGQRAQQAYDYARPIVDSHYTSENDPARYRQFIMDVQEVLAKALGVRIDEDNGVDWIQNAVIARAGELQLTAYSIAKQSGVSENHVQRYLTKKASMSSHKLQHVLRALGMKIVVAKGEP